MYTNRDLQALKALIGSPEVAAEIRKTLTAGTGFVGINLEEPAKLMIPFYAGLRNRLPVDRPKQGGAEAIWRMQLGHGSFDFAAAQGTANGGIGSQVAHSVVTVQAPYHTQAVAGDVEYEAIPQARGFDDPLQIETISTLAALLKLEELLVLGGSSVKLPKVTGLAATVHSTGSLTIPGYVQVTALTLQGYLANLAGNSTVGESEPCSEIAISGSGASKDYADISWDPVPGAVAYKVYVGGTGAEKLLMPSAMYYTKSAAAGDQMTYGGGSVLSTFVTVNKVQMKAVATSTAVPTGDHSVNTAVGEGLISWCQKPSPYGYDLGTYQTTVDCGGAELTVAGSGIAEFDQVLSTLWSIWQTSPSLIVGSPNSVAAITSALMEVNSNALYRIELSAERGGFVGGTYIGGYVNKFAASMLAGQQANVPIWAHPYMPDGTILFLSERIPYQYSREARAFALDVQTPYTYFELARSTRTFPFSNFFTEVLKCYHPAAQASIVNARVG